MQNIKLDPNITITYYTIINALMSIAVTEAAVRRCSGPKLATLLKVTLFHGCFSHFLNCTNCTKSRNASHLLKHPFDSNHSQVWEKVLKSHSQV